MSRPVHVVLAVLAFLPISTVAIAADDAEKPNIVVFLVDDLGWQDVSVPMWTKRTPFNDHFRTPNVERLAATGVRFWQSYSCAVCSPTRTSLMTGQNAARHHVTQWTRDPSRDPSGKTDRLESPKGWRLEGLQPGDVTLPALLQKRGYFTIHAGKAHWGAAGTPGSDPRQLGFDVNIAGHEAGGPGSYHGQHDYSAQWRNGSSVWDVPGLEHYHGLPVHLTDATTVEALRAVDRALDDEKPFYLYLAHYAVHAPIEEHRPYADRYRESGVDEPESRYASMVEGFDASLGAVLRHLERRGVAESTLVVFTSDNGGLSVHSRGQTPRGTGKNTHNWPLREGKGSAYEGGTRVPTVISWAKRQDDHLAQQRLPIEADAVRETPIIVEDLFPTILRWTGAELPADHPIDGVDLSPLLTSDEGISRERPLLFHYPHVWGPKGKGYQPHTSLRLGDWKAIYFYEPRRWELYDLASDLSEEHDLSSEEPERLAMLSARMLELLKARGAQWPTVTANGEAEPIQRPGTD
ncbi:MAG: sulfatase [Planctomycetota bacterium]